MKIGGGVPPPKSPGGEVHCNRCIVPERELRMPGPGGEVMGPSWQPSQRAAEAMIQELVNCFADGNPNKVGLKKFTQSDRDT